MSAQADFDSMVARIKAELNSVGRLNPGPIPRQGVTVITSPDLTPGWIGISDDEGRRAFGPASEILSMIRSYVRRVKEEGVPLFLRQDSFWLLMRDFPCEQGEEFSSR
jgi:hypothetical protein